MDLSKIIKIFKMTETRLKSYVTKELKKEYKEVIVGDGYVFARGTFPVLLVAHMDTVHKECPCTFETDEKRKTLSSPQGIGGDDRNGIYSILQIIKTHKCSVLFTEQEEIGGVGADKFIKTALAEELRVNKAFNYIIELDRKGSIDAVFYDCDNPEFTEFITQDFWIKSFGSFSDISIIAPFLECAAVNLSCGYYKAHTKDEYIVYDEIDLCIEEVKKLLDRTDVEKQFEYIESKYSYNNYYCNYGNYGYGNNLDEEEYYESQFTIVFVETLIAKCVKIEKVKASTENEALGKFFKKHPTLSYNHIRKITEKKWWECYTAIEDDGQYRF